MMNAHCDAFEQDVFCNGGYLYSINSSLSSRLAHSRFNEAIQSATDFYNKRVLDLGCGDGTFSIDLYDRTNPSKLYGIDLCSGAIEIAKRNVGSRRISFSVGRAPALPFPDDHFDWICFRHVIHHLDAPVGTLREAFRVGNRVVMIEPNGNNPLLKILEKISPYHRRHKEKSYRPSTLKRWISQVGFSIIHEQWLNFIPTFCPDWSAKILGKIEPEIERMAFFNRILCGAYLLVAQRER